MNDPDDVSSIVKMKKQPPPKPPPYHTSRSKSAPSTNQRVHHSPPLPRLPEIPAGHSPDERRAGGKAVFNGQTNKSANCSVTKDDAVRTVESGYILPPLPGKKKRFPSPMIATTTPKTLSKCPLPLAPVTFHCHDPPNLPTPQQTTVAPENVLKTSSNKLQVYSKDQLLVQPSTSVDELENISLSRSSSPGSDAYPPPVKLDLTLKNIITPRVRPPVPPKPKHLTKKHTLNDQVKLSQEDEDIEPYAVCDLVESEKDDDEYSYVKMSMHLPDTEQKDISPLTVSYYTHLNVSTSSIDKNVYTDLRPMKKKDLHKATSFPLISNQTDLTSSEEYYASLLVRDEDSKYQDLFVPRRQLVKQQSEHIYI